MKLEWVGSMEVKELYRDSLSKESAVQRDVRKGFEGNVRVEVRGVRDARSNRVSPDRSAARWEICMCRNILEQFMALPLLMEVLQFFVPLVPNLESTCLQTGRISQVGWLIKQLQWMEISMLITSRCVDQIWTLCWQMVKDTWWKLFVTKNTWVLSRNVMWWVATFCFFESIFTDLTRCQLVRITKLLMVLTLTISAT